MRRFVIHLFIAVLTFAIGIVASMLWGGVLAPSVQKAKSSAFSVSKAPLEQPIKGEHPSRCGCSQSQDETTVADSAESGAPIRGGILNGKALSLPRPPYPAIAKAARASGSVAVEVVVDERGCVQSAHAVGGHPLLQSAAVQAAQHACFSPTRLSGRPVKVSGVITYNFALQ
jgi:TonB family protein